MCANRKENYSQHGYGAISFNLSPTRENDDREENGEGQIHQEQQAVDHSGDEHPFFDLVS